MSTLRTAFGLYPDGLKRGLAKDTGVNYRTLYRVSDGYHQRSPDHQLELVRQAFDDRPAVCKEDLERKLGGWRPWVLEDLWAAWHRARRQWVANHLGAYTGAKKEVHTDV